MDDNPDKTDWPPSSARKGKGFGTQFGMAMELPFVLFGAIAIGGLLGYFLDHWLHTSWIWIAGLIFGAVAGFVQMIRVAMGMMK